MEKNPAVKAMMEDPAQVKEMLDKFKDPKIMELAIKQGEPSTPSFRLAMFGLTPFSLSNRNLFEFCVAET